MSRRVKVVVGLAVVLAIAIAAVVVAVVADRGDDGAGVRTIGGEPSGSASGSATGSASGSATHPGSASAPGSATGSGARCRPVGDLTTATTTVNVRLDEWVIVASPRSVPAGRVAFVVENVGEEPHELVIVKGVAPRDLPTDRRGALAESRLPAGSLIGEIEAFPPGETCDGVFSLAPGEYTLVCNLTEGEHGKVESHLAEGMVTTLTVT